MGNGLYAVAMAMACRLWTILLAMYEPWAMAARLWAMGSFWHQFHGKSIGDEAELR